MYRYFLLFGFFLACSCSKENPDLTNQDSKLSIVLYNKPLDTIKAYTNGKWQLRYFSGGWCPGCIVQRDSYEELWTFANGKLIQSITNQIVEDTIIDWYRMKDVFGDSTYLLNFESRKGYWNSYVVDKIFNDTLILFDNATDPFKYRFTRIK